MLNNIWKITEDALVCLGVANWELVQRRKDAMKPHIAKDYSHLCSQKIPITDMLFRDNVTKQIKDIIDDNKVTHKLLDSKMWRRDTRQSFAHGQYRSRAGGAYRGSGYSYNRSRSTQGLF